MKYILHDTTAIDDEKLGELFIAFGYEGIGLFWAILEKIGKQEKPIKTIVLKSQLKVGRKLDKCWKFMESLGLISSNNGETFNERILSYSEKYQSKKEKTRERVAQWRENQEKEKNVTSYEHEGNACKVKESKVKESKEREQEKESISPQKNESENTVHQSNNLENSNLFRKPNIPTKEQVWEVFSRGGGTKEMAKSFWEKHDGTGWYLNGSPIINYSSLANKFIENWNRYEQKDKNRFTQPDPAKVKISLP